VADKFVGKSVDSGEPYGTFHYTMQEDGIHAQRLSASEPSSIPLHFALGSGRNAVTLFSLIPDGNNETAGLEHRVSWFGSHHDFGLTPGHAGKSPHADIDYFGDLVHGKSMRECVHCHTTSGTIVGTDIVDLVANVNCERCHGPGSEHVRQSRQSPTPPPYSVGRDHWDLESELQLCGSCHRLPRNVSLQALREYRGELLRFQPIGLLRSACYLESDGKFMCTTCHNPHADSKSKSKEAYNQDCRNCHLPDSDTHVACPVSPQDNCIECHMPATTFEQGMVFHDHWIRVREDE
jgi:hypothetical protein